ncbi:MAG: glycerophosphodiester phosphodiesterase [Deinococcales bacterium]
MPNRVKFSMALLLGHRGANRQYLENTMPAFEAAIAAGLDGIELDVQRTQDGVLVVHHDFHLPDGRLIAALNYQDLRLPNGYSVPKLEEVLRWAKHRGVYVNVEIKLETISTDGREREVAALVERMGVGEQVIISSFNPFSLLRVRYHAPALETALLYYHSPKTPWWLRDALTAPLLGVAAIHPHHSLVTAQLMQKTKQRGWKVNVWTVNEAQDVARLLELGVDGIIGDLPEVLLAQRNLPFS